MVLQSVLKKVNFFKLSFDRNPDRLAPGLRQAASQARVQESFSSRYENYGNEIILNFTLVAIGGYSRVNRQFIKNFY